MLILILTLSDDAIACREVDRIVVPIGAVPHLPTVHELIIDEGHILFARLRLHNVVRVEEDQLAAVAGARLRDGQATGQLLHIIIELGKDVTCALLRDLQNHALWLLHIEGRNEHACLARTDLDYVVSTAHTLALLVEHNPVLIEDASLAVYDGT